MDQAQLELQLKVWQELAISKQVLMRTATEALKLDPDCNQDDLKKALDAAIKKSLEADASVSTAQEQARLAVAVMEKKLSISQQAQSVAEAATADMAAKLERSSQEMAIERATAAKEVQQSKDRAAEKDKALKAINAALADTPENVLKKMKALKKEKQDEADSRRDIEASLNVVRKEKRDQDQKLKELQDNTTKLITGYRDLHAVTTKVHEQLTAADAKDIPALPELDADLLLAIEDPEAAKKKEKEKENGKDKKKK